MSRDPREHLTEDESTAFVREELPEELEGEIVRHLEHCVICARQLEDFYAAEEEFPAEEWAARRARFMDALEQRVFGPPLWERLRNLILPHPVALASAWAADSSIEDGQTKDGMLQWRFVEDGAGNLTVRFGSRAMELEGVRVRLRAGPLQRDAVFREEAPDQVVAETVIAREERAELPADAELRVDLIPKDTASQARSSVE